MCVCVCVCVFAHPLALSVLPLGPSRCIQRCRVVGWSDPAAHQALLEDNSVLNPHLPELGRHVTSELPQTGLALGAVKK